MKRPRKELNLPARLMGFGAICSLFVLNATEHDALLGNSDHIKNRYKLTHEQKSQQY